MWQAITAGALLGLVGSFHCVGMCGPLALALPVQHLNRARQVMAILMYNAGRVITYSLAGALFGWAGRGIYIAGFQQWFSIALGCAILLLLVWRSLTPVWLRSFHYKVQQVFSRLSQIQKNYKFIFLGMTNGMLPCGMVYLAIAGALSGASITGSVLFMAAFGTATLPAMLALSLFGVHIKLSMRQQLKKAVPYVMAGMAILLILRGMNLGIPFISPVLAGVPRAAVSCH